MKQQQLFKKRDYSRPFKNSGVAYKPKKEKKELKVQIRLARHTRRYYPWVIFHSDYSAGLDLSKHQAETNALLQSKDKFPDFTVFAPGRINPKTGKRYIGLALELKADGVIVIKKDGTLTSDPHIREQAKTLKKLIDQGWYANFAVGFDQAAKMEDWYFERDQRELF